MANRAGLIAAPRVFPRAEMFAARRGGPAQRGLPALHVTDLGDPRLRALPVQPAVAEAAILLHPPLHSAGVSIVVGERSVSEMTVSSTALGAAGRAGRGDRCELLRAHEGESWRPTAATPADNPYCSCKLTSSSA